MNDHLIYHTTEADALANAGLAPWIRDSDEGPVWDLSRVIPGVRPILARAVWSADGETMVSPQQELPGFFLCISSRRREPREELTELDEHILCANRELACAGFPAVYADGLRYDLAANGVIAIDGLPAGSDYFREPAEVIA